MQLLLKQRPDWRGKNAVWLPSLKADARVRYLTPQAARAGVRLGGRYATLLGVVPGLLAGTCGSQELAEADAGILEILRRFSPVIRRRSEHLENGLYLLDASGLERAFHGMRSWSRELLTALAQAGWEGRLAVGFTAFATEMATYRLRRERPIRMFHSLRQEEKSTLETPLTAFSLNPDQIARLRRFQIVTMGEFLCLDTEEVKRRFGSDLLEFYQRAAGAIFASFPPLPEPEPLGAQFGFTQPVSDLEPLLLATRRLLSDLLPRILSQEQAVAGIWLQMLTEDERCHQQVLRPTCPTADLDWLMQLVRLRLEQYFQKHPLRWGSRVERLVVELQGEADPEKQGELFSDWALDVDSGGEERLAPRDKQAGLWALSQVRAEFGEGCLVRAHLADHHLPERDHYWKPEQESLSWLSRWVKGSAASRRSSASPSAAPQGLAQDVRVRRILYQRMRLSRRSDWSECYGPYSLSGGWWSDDPYEREYYFAQKGRQTAWLSCTMERSPCGTMERSPCGTMERSPCGRRQDGSRAMERSPTGNSQVQGWLQ